MGGLPSSRLLKGRGSVAPGDDSIADTDSVDGANEEVEKWLAWVTSESDPGANPEHVLQMSSVTICGLALLH